MIVPHSFRKFYPAAGRLAAVGILWSITACTSYQAKPITVEQGVKEFSSRTLASAMQAAGEKVPGKWDFPSLATASSQLHGDVRLARAQAETAKAALQTAGARPNPTLGFAPERAIPGGGSPWVMGFTLDVPIETGGKRNARVAKAVAEAQTAALHVTEVMWANRSKLRKAWIDLHGAQRRMAVLAKQLGVQEETVKFLEAQVQAGEMARPVLLQSKLLVSQTKLLAATAKKQAAEAQADVAVEVGVPQSALQNVGFDFSKLEKPASLPSAKALRQAAATQRPDVLSALAEYAAAESALRLEVAKQYPDVHLGPGYQFDQGVNKWALGVNLTLPIFDKNRGPIAEAEAKRTEAAVKVESAQVKAMGEVDRALVSYEACVQRQQTADALLAEQKKQLESAEAMVKAGEGDRLSALSAEVELSAAELGRLEAEIETQQALGAVEDASQRPL
jgi:cobalt-zinc-cadmium efflux system outer membrane protein